MISCINAISNSVCIIGWSWYFRISDLVKTLMELIFSPCCEFRWSPEGPVIQIYSPYLHVGAPGIFLKLNVCSDAKERVWWGKHRDGTALIQSLVKLLPWFLTLRWKTCLPQNCSLGSCAYSEGPALGLNTLMMIGCGSLSISNMKTLIHDENHLNMFEKYNEIYSSINIFRI